MEPPEQDACLTNPISQLQIEVRGSASMSKGESYSGGCLTSISGPHKHVCTAPAHTCGHAHTLLTYT